MSISSLLYIVIEDDSIPLNNIYNLGTLHVCLELFSEVERNVGIMQCNGLSISLAVIAVATAHRSLQLKWKAADQFLFSIGELLASWPAAAWLAGISSSSRIFSQQIGQRFQQTAKVLVTVNCQVLWPLEAIHFLFHYPVLRDSFYCWDYMNTFTSGLHCCCSLNNYMKRTPQPDGEACLFRHLLHFRTSFIVIFVTFTVLVCCSIFLDSPTIMMKPTGEFLTLKHQS